MLIHKTYLRVPFLNLFINLVQRIRRLKLSQWANEIAQTVANETFTIIQTTLSYLDYYYRLSRIDLTNVMGQLEGRERIILNRPTLLRAVPVPRPRVRVFMRRGEVSSVDS